MNIKQARMDFIFKKKIFIDEDETEFIVMREPSQIEMREFSKPDNESEILKVFQKCIVEHSFTNDDGQPAKNAEVASFLIDSVSKFNEIVKTWIDSIPLVVKNKANLDKSQE